ncbi:MAG: ABC transporter ATP-binding protein [Oscillibacter sp.]|nr:ABC transporter ATP-binding protein [Oscillibacter sp.]
MIECKNICAGYRNVTILHDLTFTIPTGGLVSIIGPNGCGKTTLLRTMAKQIPPQSGTVLYDGVDIATISRKDLARTAAFLPQVRPIPSISVQALVSHGRFPHLGFSRTLRPEDRIAVQRAMEQTGITPWANRSLDSLSGGERQRVYLAMALAQETDIIFLDEPTTYLDLHYQFDLLELLQQLQRSGKTIVMVLHDLSSALRYSTQVVLMDQGQLLFSDSPQALRNTDLLAQTFHVQTRFFDDHVLFEPLG